MKKPCRHVVVPLPPRGLRPKLSRTQVIELGICHMQNLDDIARGCATEQVLWHVVEAALTWSRVAQLLQAGVPEMTRQVELSKDLIRRYGRTGRIAFTGPEYLLAKEGIDVMDQLAEIVDKPTAVAAAEWSEAQVAMLVDIQAVASRAAA